MAEYAPEYYEQYRKAQASHWWFRGREAVLQAIVPPVVQLPPGHLVIDVGSGPGGPTPAVFPNQHITAVDLSLSALKAYSAAATRIVADGARLPFAVGSVQVVCAFDVLEHIENDIGALRNWRQMLATNGWLVITVPAYEALWSRHDEANRHQRRYRASILRRRLEQAGFDVVRLTYFNTVLLPAIAAVRWADRKDDGSGRGDGAPVSAHAGQLDFTRRFPLWVERCCEAAFRFERQWLTRWTLPAGVSICAIARRQTL
jgi:SAM-dependent methyltransferase